jgi:hypothetical protein
MIDLSCSDMVTEGFGSESVEELCNKITSEGGRVVSINYIYEVGVWFVWFEGDDRIDSKV